MLRSGSVVTRCLNPQVQPSRSQTHGRWLYTYAITDKDFLSGDYAASLRGTQWHDRLVVGAKGAHLQVRFIEQAAPIGSHILVADDNIQNIVVEIAAERHKIRSANGAEYWSRSVDCFTSQGL